MSIRQYLFSSEEIAQKAKRLIKAVNRCFVVHVVGVGHGYYEIQLDGSVLTETDLECYVGIKVEEFDAALANE